MSDPLDILRTDHPDLTWSQIPDRYTRLVGVGDDDSIEVGYDADGEPSPEYAVIVKVGGRRYTERGSARLGVVSADLVDLRRAIGWPVPA